MEHPLILNINNILKMVNHEKKEHTINSNAYKTSQEVIQYLEGLRYLLKTQSSSQNNILEYVIKHGDISHFIENIQCPNLDREKEYKEKQSRFRCLLLNMLMFFDMEFNPFMSDDSENDYSWFLLQARILRIKIV